MMRTQLTIAGFENGGRRPSVKGRGCPLEMENAREQITLRASRRNAPLLTSCLVQ